MRQAPGPSTRIDITGAMFSMAAPEPAPLTITPHLVALIYCPPGESGQGVFEVVFRRGLDARTTSRSPATSARSPSSRASSPTAWCAASSSSPTTARSSPTAASTAAPGTSCRSPCCPRPDVTRPSGPLAALAATARSSRGAPTSWASVASDGYIRTGVIRPRSRTSRRSTHPRLRHGRAAQGQERAPGHGDGARAPRARAVQPDHAATTRPTRRGPTATASCCPTATPRSCSTRCCSSPASASSWTTSRRSASGGRARPGHPEARHTPGIEVTTGPARPGLRQLRGHGDRRAPARARFGADVMDHHTFVIAGDGCFMEGVSHEAASLAGHLGSAT